MINNTKLIMKSKQTILQERDLNDKGRAQQFIDSEVLRLCDPYVPEKDRILIKSGTSNTIIGSGQVKYNTPYARKWYYKPAKFSGAPKRGNYWFERMKKEGGRERILRGVSKLTGAKER